MRPSSSTIFHPSVLSSLGVRQVLLGHMHPQIFRVPSAGTEQTPLLNDLHRNTAGIHMSLRTHHVVHKSNASLNLSPHVIRRVFSRRMKMVWTLRLIGRLVTKKCGSCVPNTNRSFGHPARNLSSTCQRPLVSWSRGWSSVGDAPHLADLTRISKKNQNRR